MSQCDGVLVVQLVTQLTGHRGQHGVIILQVVAVLVLLIDREVRHAHVRDGQQVAGVTLVLGVGQRDVRLNLDAVANEVVEVHTRGEAVELLLDDRTRLMVVAGSDAEVGLLTATAQSQVVFLAPAGLLHQLQPVGIVVIHLVLRERGVVVQLGDVTGLVTHGGVEVLLLQQHRVLVTVQHLVALRLVGTSQTEAVVDAGLTTRTTLGLDLDDTVRTLRTPDGGCGSILQHRDALDILRVDVQQFGKLLLVGRREVEVVDVGLPHVTVDHDQRLTRTVDTRHTAQAHRRARTQVT